MHAASTELNKNNESQMLIKTSKRILGFVHVMRKCQALRDFLVSIIIFYLYDLVDLY